MKTMKFAALFSALLCVLCFVGCGGDKWPCTVEATVTLDGQPLETGHISLGPMVGQPGTASGGDIVNGKAKFGASEGEMVVNIRCQVKQPIDNPTADEKAHGVTERQVELLPEKYNRKSELKVTLTKGKNQVNFDLQSEK